MTTQVTIQFLGPHESVRYIRQHHTAYLHDALRTHSNARVRNYRSSAQFMQGVLPWRMSWQDAVERAVQSCVSRLWSWKRWLCTPWTFIAVDSQRIDGGLPHTIHHAIVLPQWLIESFLDEPLASDAVETLLHEKIHTLQKTETHAPFFRDLYRAWGWFPIEESAVPHMIRQVHRANPDTQTWWALRSPRGDTLIPCARLRPGARELTNVDYFLVRLVRDHEVEWIPMLPSTDKDARANDDDLTIWYHAYYGGRAHCYHPEECSAVILAAWLIAEWQHEESFAPPATVFDGEAERVLVSRLIEYNMK